MAHFYPITLREMLDFLEPKGFSRLDLGSQIKEVVMGRRMVGIVDLSGKDIPLTLRIFTGIDVRGNTSRAAGQDAIRVSLWARIGGEVVMLAGQKRVHRVEGWRSNLQDRLNKWEDLIGLRCPNCGWPMHLIAPRKGQDWEPFLGCLNFKATKCRGSRPFDTSAARIYGGK